MKQYCLHLTNNLSEFKIYEYAGGSYTTNFTVGFGELAKYIQADDKVFLFLPSNLIHAFVAVRRECLPSEKIKVWQNTSAVKPVQ